MAIEVELVGGPSDGQVMMLAMPATVLVVQTEQYSYAYGLATIAEYHETPGRIKYVLRQSWLTMTHINCKCHPGQPDTPGQDPPS